MTQVNYIPSREWAWVCKLLKFDQVGRATASGGAKEVNTLQIELALVIISAATLVVAFAALVLKIIEVARSK